MLRRRSARPEVLHWRDELRPWRDLYVHRLPEELHQRRELRRQVGPRLQERLLLFPNHQGAAEDRRVHVEGGLQRREDLRR